MFTTEQENFWANSFGDDYIERNKSGEYLASNVNFFSKILEQTIGVNKVIEFGANVGLNLKAIQILRSDIKLTGLEINKNAHKTLSKIDNVEGINESLLEYHPNGRTWDLCFVKGVLIHLNPDCLDKAYSLLYETSNKYILIAEYFNPTPVSIEYRGHKDRLFKRDFAGEMMDKYPDLNLRDYGFVYKRDNNFSQDNMNWFLLEKR